MTVALAGDALAGVLGDVAEHFGLTREALAERLFRAIAVCRRRRG